MQPIHLLVMDESKGELRVDRFPDAPRAVHTLNIVTAHYAGKVTVEATIKIDPQEEDWFIVHEEVFIPLTVNEQARRNRSTNLVGRFISMRATAERLTGFTGIVDRVTLI